MTEHEDTWSEGNQRYLVAVLAEVRARLEQYAAEVGSAAAQDVPPLRWGGAEDGESLLTVPPALELLCSVFHLSAFERAILLLCAGVELDSTFAGLCAAAQEEPARSYPTFSLALAAFPDAHWSALTPEAPLRRWRLIEVVQAPASSLTTRPLRIDERVLHFLAGIQELDERLVGLVEPVSSPPELVPSHAAQAERIAVAWTRRGGALPVLQLCGADEVSRRAIAAAGCAAVGLNLFCLPADGVPTNATELEALARLWEREAALTSSALYVEAETVDRTDARTVTAISRLLERLNSALLLGTSERWRPLRRAMLTLDVHKPTAQEQRALWQAALGEAHVHLNGHIPSLASQFNLAPSAIHAVVCEALASGADGPALAAELWNAGRAQSRPRLDDLAQRIQPVATWDDLVLPEAERRMLAEIAGHVAHRATVYETWGFGAMSSRGLGISVLFAGASGTGKTMAAEVLANHLRLDLYRIDLSAVVSKYIGETEKNLRRVFDVAEDGGAILFFDEADALFGKRSEVKDSHDRYANIEINYLLQRMEQYSGLAVLATNMRGALDSAFMRRIRFMINFPLPDVAQRVQIWRRIFPPDTPTEGLDIGKLARLNITGGNIRNIALNAAFLAAAEGVPVRMSHLLRATRSEYAKIDKPLTEAEIGG
jgi:hypothetical protein